MNYSRFAIVFTAAIAVPFFACAHDWISLFDGETFDGWQVNESPESWAIEEGALKTQGTRSHLFYVGEVAGHEFKNFEFAADVLTEPGSNSGIYVHTKFQEEGWPAAGYELQVLNSNPSGKSGYIEHKMTGSVYAVRNTWKSPAADNVWFDYRIRVEGKTIKTFIDGELICEYTEPETPWRPDDKKQRLLSSGTFAFQAHDPGSIVRYRNIRVRLLPDNLPSSGSPLNDADLSESITRNSNDNTPLIDIGLRPETAAQAKRLAYDARQYGVTPIDADLTAAPASLLVVNDRDKAPDIAALKAAKAAGMKVVFSSGGASSLDESRLKTRLQAIRAAELGWEDFWVPGK